MLYPAMAIAALGGLVYPSINSLMSQQVSERSQGELQGGVASLHSLSSIIGPPFMTQIFGYFTRDDARLVVPGAPFLCAALLGALSLWLLLRAVRRVETPSVASSHDRRGHSAPPA